MPFLTAPSPDAMTDPTPIHPDMLPPETRWLADRYEFLSELGRGGMAVVYLARERESGRQVAIKVVSSRYAGNGDAIRRFAREARTVAGLHHPNVVRTLAIEERDGAVAIVHAYVHGETLRSALNRAGAFSFDEALEVLRDVASALAYAHGRRIVHRDVKPENVFLLDGSRKALLADFGIARSLDVDTLLTAAGASLGTPAYMSPEQVDGRAVDERTDVYALGLVGWEMLAGRRPWYGETLYAMLHKQKHEALPALGALRPDIPAFLLAAIDGALEKAPERRWRDAAEMLARLTPQPATLPAVAARGEGEERDANTVQLLVPPVALSASVPAAAEPVMREPNVAEPNVAEPIVAEPVATVAEEVPPPRPRRASRWPLVAGAGAVAAAALLAVAVQGRGDAPTERAGSPALDSMRVAASGDSSAPPPRTTEAAGEVRLPTRRPDTPRATPATPVARETPPVARETPPAASVPAASVPAALVARDRRCGSAESADQRGCLLGQIEREDVPLNRTYGALIGALRRGPGGEGAVQALRVQQRAWLVERDRTCRARHPVSAAGAMWGAARVPCFGELSAKREAELAARLAAARSR